MNNTPESSTTSDSLGAVDTLELALSREPANPERYVPSYGDLVQLNTSRLIVDSVGKESLAAIAQDFLELLGTSSAIYERNGDYALGIFASGWCRLLDQASFRLCGTDDPRAALSSGRWHCHESCWADASRTAIEEDRETDVQCCGGLRLFVVPIHAEGEVVGAINFGYGDPPQDEAALAEIADLFRVDPAELKQQAEEYLPRPGVLIDMARNRLRGAARVVGTMVERELARRRLGDSERRFRSLVGSMDEGMCLHELVRDGHGRAVDYRLLEVNPAFEGLTGIPREQAVGALASELYGTGSPPFLEIYARVAEGGTPERFETFFEAMGKHFSVSVFRPEPDRFGTVFTDVTARKRSENEHQRLEEQIRHVQKLESLGVLAGGIAHDFNNILMAILGNADLARVELPMSSPVRAHMIEIEHAARRAADLCRQMLAYSGKGRFVVETVDLSQVVREMAEMLKISVSKKASLRYDFAEDLPPVEVDVTQLRQVVMNLITNASEALGDQAGVIAVSSGAMRCDRSYLSESYLDEGLEEGLYVFLEVSDSGCGMTLDTVSRIFDPFFSTKFTGRGLGLAAVLGIVRGHRGAIKVYSEPGRGTSFKVLLPAVAAEPVAASPCGPASVTRWRGQGTVLLADDEPAVRAVGERLLERLGFDVVLAADGGQALELFARDPQSFECVILDLMMPSMGGEEAFRELRRLRADVRVILSSGYNEQEVTQRFAGKGLAGFLQKPYDLDTLERALRKILLGPGEPR